MEEGGNLRIVVKARVGKEGKRKIVVLGEWSREKLEEFLKNMEALGV